MCGFLVGGWSEEAREWGSVGKPGGALRRNGGASVPTVGDSRARGRRDYRRSAFLAQGTGSAWQEVLRHEKSPGRTTGALSERYISFVDSSFSSTHSLSRMTGFLSTRPSRSAGTR